MRMSSGAATRSARFRPTEEHGTVARRPPEGAQNQSLVAGGNEEGSALNFFC